LTVCIAARCREGFIFCASDRMVTAGDIEVEQGTPKIIRIAPSIYLMMSDDDAALHSEILSDLSLRALEQENNKPNAWTVREIADLYAFCYEEARLKRAEWEFLLPQGLNRSSFIEQQKIMDSAMVDQITRDMIHHKMPHMAVVIAGVDTLGSHIYVAHNGDEGRMDVGCYDSIGFAAIGAGGRHARSAFMLAGHKWDSPAHEALLLTYVAKKRAEIAPGVGPTTDMILIGPQLGHADIVNPTVVKKIDKEYRRLKVREDRAYKAPQMEMERYVTQELPKQAAIQQEKTQPTGTAAPSKGPTDRNTGA
jgi:hypothetical protein